MKRGTVAAWIGYRRYSELESFCSCGRRFLSAEDRERGDHQGRA